MPDVLPGFSATALGPATLVRHDHAPQAPRAVMVHVHGYNDYFFNPELAQEAARHGYAFYAVDLRRAGRSIRPDDYPHDMADVAEPGEDIAAAVDAVATAHPGLPVVVHAHSTGGLSTLVWAADRRHPSLAGVALNSPLFGRILTRNQKVAIHALPVLTRFTPRRIVSKHPSVYAKHLHVSGGGEWDFDTVLKTPAGVPVRAQWLSAVRSTQRRIAAGLGLDLPVLVARASATGPERDTNPLLNEQDIVVDVRAIERLAPRIGPRVTQLVVPGGIHDLSLSRPGPRRVYLNAMFAWADGVVT